MIKLPSTILVVWALVAFSALFGQDTGSAGPGTYAIIENYPGIEKYAGRDGAKEARSDFQEGRGRYLVFGRLAGLVFLPEWRKAAKERFGIQIECIAGCFVTSELVSYASAYNTAVLREIAGKYGDGDWAALREEIRQKFLAEHRKVPNQSLLRNAGSSVRFPSDVGGPAWQI